MSPRDASTNCAPVDAAISAKVDGGGRLKNAGCVIPSVAVGGHGHVQNVVPPPNLNSCTRSNLPLVIGTA